MSPRNLTLAALLAATVFIAMPKAHAGYAQVAPPAGWSVGTGATYGTVPARLGAAAANGGTFWSGSTVINAGGRAVTIPAAGRFAANAGRYAARGLMLNPLALGIAGAAWLASECIGYESGSWVRTCGVTPDPKPSDGMEYFASSANSWHKSASEAGTAEAAVLKGLLGWASINIGTCRTDSGNGRWSCGGTFQRDPGGAVEESSNLVQGNTRASSCPAGWYVTAAGCVQTPPPKTMTPQEVEDKMAPKPIPPEVFPEIPNVPLPIEKPSINPSPAPDYTPQPLHVPTGDPVKVPNTTPQRWDQPIITINPSPTPESPWRVNITPETVKKYNPEPIRDPWTGPLPNPPPVVNPNPGDPPLPDPEIEPDPSRDPEVAPTDTELPELPKLYEPKYKNGLEGVWLEQKDKIKSAPLSNLIENLMPKVSGGGSCPTWNVQLEFSTWANYGSKNVAPPCEVWDWGRMIILVSALILARALIFGG